MKILNYKDKILYRTARDVSESEFGESLAKYMSDMAVMMYSLGGVGLAGPQIGSDLRILVADMAYVDGGQYGSNLLKMVNPKVVSSSGYSIKAEEECLSYPGLKVTVDRDDQVTVSYKTPFGEEAEQTFQNWQARVVLHEMDHLDGVTLYSRSGSLSKKKYDSMVKKNLK